jgi:hypothetical protein
MSLTSIPVIVTEEQRLFFEKNYRKDGGAKSLSDFIVLAGYRRLREVGVRIPTQIEETM